MFIFIVLAWILNPYFSFGYVIHLLAHFVPHTAAPFGSHRDSVGFGDSIAVTFKIFSSTARSEKKRSGCMQDELRTWCDFVVVVFEMMAIIKCNATAHKTILKIAVAKKNCFVHRRERKKNNQRQCNNVKLVQEPSTTGARKKIALNK